MPQKRISEFILSNLLLLLLLAIPTTSVAQSKRKVVVAEKDTIPFWRGIAVSFDLIGLGQILWSDYGQYEGALRLNLKDKYFPIIEAGYGKADSDDPTTQLHYTSKAPYGRIGCDFNVLNDKHEFYRIYLGARYAYSSFKYDIESPPITDPVWNEDVEISSYDVSCSYHWIEFVASCDTKIVGPLRLGWSVRYKRRLFHKEGDIGDPWYVPGYGRSGGSRIGGTFNVILEL